MSTHDDRDKIVEWFAAGCGWVNVEDFIAAWSGAITPGQGRSDLAKLVREGRLEKRVDWTRMRRANKHGRGGPTVEYRAVAP